MSKKDRNHLDLLFDIGELADLLTGCSDMESFLQQTVELVAGHLYAHVCSIYLYEEKTDQLVLKATKGLNPNAIDAVRMNPEEGLVGFSFKMFQVICEGNARENPNFKHFIEADEDAYNSFLSVPIKRGEVKIGVIVVEHEERGYFNAFDIRALRTAASQLAGSIENVRLLMELQPDEFCLQDFSSDLSIQLIKGESGTAGHAYGPSTVFKKHSEMLFVEKVGSEKKYTLDDFYTAVERTSWQLKAMQEGFAERLPESASMIFDAHFMILKDRRFAGKMTTMIQEGRSPLEAVSAVARKYMEKFSSSSNAYIREKALDVEDLAVRILRNLQMENGEYTPDRRRVVVAKELYPSDILKLASGETLGIIFVGGGVASHVAILARSLKIPLVITDEQTLLTIPERTPVLVDADLGNIYLNPSEDTIQLFETKKRTERDIASQGQSMSAETKTVDGARVTLRANINLLSEISLAKKLKAEGIGLYRTEFPFLIRQTFPSEDEQYAIYKKLFDSMGGGMVTIRTLDAGGEKVLSYSDAEKENNPELGLRSIRFSLAHRDIFKLQIRAILRAAAEREDVGIMFPLISSIDEFLEAKTIVKECMASLEDEGVPYNATVSIGTMIELPSVLETLDEFAKAADFFSIGTNDFIQYMLAADRTNKMVEKYYLPHHPAVLRGLSKIAKAADRAGIDVTVCGEMAHETKYIPFLLGIGISSLSIDPQFLPAVQKRISALSMRDATLHATQLLSETTVKGVLEVLDLMA